MHGMRSFFRHGVRRRSTFSNHFCYICLPPTCVRFLGFLSAKLFYMKCKSLLLDRRWGAAPLSYMTVGGRGLGVGKSGRVEHCGE